MPYRIITPKSDRGSIRDIQKKNENQLEENPEMPPTPAELRIKAMYEHALVSKDRAMIASLGLIVMEGSVHDPVSLMKHREYINQLKDKFGMSVDETAKELRELVDETQSVEMQIAANKQANARNAILHDDNGPLIKSASSFSSVRSFWRVK